MERRLILVTGSPRSGTRFMGRVLSRAGLRVAHEHMAEHGTASSLFAADGPYLGSIHHLFHLGETRSNYEFEHVWHLVREPREVLSSLATAMDQPKFWEFQARETGVVEDAEPLSRALRFWVAWNELVERQATRRVRVEDVESDWPALSASLGITAPCPVVAHTVGKSIRKVPVSWEEFAAADPEATEQAIKKAVEYGYGGTLP